MKMFPRGRFPIALLLFPFSSCSKMGKLLGKKKIHELFSIHIFSLGVLAADSFNCRCKHEGDNLLPLGGMYDNAAEGANCAKLDFPLL